MSALRTNLLNAEGALTSSNFSTETTPLTPTLVIVPSAGMHARVAKAVAVLASALVGSRSGKGDEGTKACEGERRVSSRPSDEEASRRHSQRSTRRRDHTSVLPLLPERPRQPLHRCTGGEPRKVSLSSLATTAKLENARRDVRIATIRF